MILIRVHDSGLGNQMFIYALGTVLKKKFPTHDIKYNVYGLSDKVAGRRMRSIGDSFEFHVDVALTKDIRRITGCKYCYEIPIITKVLRRNDRNMKKYMEFIWSHRQPVKSTKFFDELALLSKRDTVASRVIEYPFQRNRDYYLMGLWQSTAYFEDYADEVRNVFSFVNKDLVNTAIAKKIKKTNSVSVHVRRGDYCHKYTDRKFDICGMEYYKEAIRYVEEKIKNPHFFFFSDDMEYVKKSFSFVKNKTLVVGHCDVDDMQLMSICKHNITANSTFSFWGAFLNKNENAVVVTPMTQYQQRLGQKRWKNILQPYCESWHRIENV